MQISVEEKHPREEFKIRDQRRVHELHTLTSLDELRAHVKRASINTQSWSPKREQFQHKQIHVMPAYSPTGEEASKVHAQWSALAAAKQHILLEKPETFDRMNKIVANCKVSGDLRKNRLDSLGVFDSEVNEVRTRTMQRVRMHQELSTTSMRLPNNMKKLKPIPSSSLNSKLERMFQKVLTSIEESKKGSPSKSPASRRVRTNFNQDQSSPSAGYGSGPSPWGHDRGEHHFATNSTMKRGVDLGHKLQHHQSSFTGREGLPSWSNSSREAPPRLSMSGRDHSLLSHRTSLAGREGLQSRVSTSGRDATISPSGTKTTSLSNTLGSKLRTSLEFSKVTMSPETAEAQLRHLAVVTEQHLVKYHYNVGEALKHLMRKEGLEEGLLNCDPQELQELLQFAAQEEEDEDEEDGDKEHNVSREVSRRVLEATRIIDLANASIDHVNVMQKEFDEMFANREPVVKKKTRRTTASTLVSLGGLHRSTQSLFSIGDKSAHTGTSEEPSRPHSADSINFEDSELAPDSSSTQLLEEKSKPMIAVPAPTSAPLTVSKPPALSEQRVKEFISTLKGTHTKYQRQNPQFPTLPRLPAAPSHSLAAQARLDRIWTMLQVPLVKRLDMVLMYASKDRVLQMERGLDAWEKASAVVLNRENLISQYRDIKQGLEIGTSSAVNVSTLERLCCSILQANIQAEAIAKILKEDCGTTLEYKGSPYPGEIDMGLPQFISMINYMQTYQGKVSLTP
ncbi:hypothetical protein CEUSTIGMA_g7213.t1 [Chlamydomonas eustigma]|uniref:Uncharacterized protein n=1 Tax=Chlamydomonas eustigma TaxID=1157962 RepID=A0A250X9J0_9CHLO|nr:hypothetical protein CEUSTIGMA_g7213.t1 [Chlamydomonas eustigma]|eukprot:GAX79773.1 hypothetical protein CEUSTIGMA_g7213.t1 [Chlamydomonas eustigma]